MLQQTRNALIYADLALFLLDTRTGITQNDVMLYKWLTQKELKLPKDEKKIKDKDTEANEKLAETVFERMKQVHGDSIPNVDKL